MNSYERTRVYSYNPSTMKFTLDHYILESAWPGNYTATTYKWSISYKYFKNSIYFLTQNPKTSSFEFDTWPADDWNANIPEGSVPSFSVVQQDDGNLDASANPTNFTSSTPGTPSVVTSDLIPW